MSESINKDYGEIFQKEKIFNLSKYEKNVFLKSHLNKLTNYHKDNCFEYKNICKNLGYNKQLKDVELEKLPFIPVSLFKNLDLKSVKKNKIIKVMNSSGTSNKKLSRIFLDKENSTNQVQVLKRIFSEVTKFEQRVPMLIIDNKERVFKKESFSARSAAFFGFSKFGRDYTFLINKKGQADTKILKSFLKKNIKQKILIFGFTDSIWKDFFTNRDILKIKPDLKDATIIHGGGWKKLEAEKISTSKFKNFVSKKFNISSNKVINYYGMIEQTGSIFFECEKNDYFHTSIFSDIIVRNKDLKDLGKNKKGFIQLLSVLPTSYPGHSLLTEDIGIVLGEDDCNCGKKGKYFKVLGRVKKSEIRGCSDAID